MIFRPSRYSGIYARSIDGKLGFIPRMGHNLNKKEFMAPDLAFSINRKYNYWLSVCIMGG